MSTTETLEEKLGFVDPVDSAEESYVDDFVLDTEQAKEAARTSMDFLAALCIPLVYRFAFPSVFLSIWTWLVTYVHKERDFSQLALGLPRGFGKTLVIKLFILYCIFFTKKKFILIICENQDKANNIISDVCDALEEGNIKRLFGDWKLGLETDRQDFKKFSFRGRNIILKGAGQGTGIRGITIKNERPDVMIFDDIQSREVADSQVQSAQLETWFLGTAKKAKSPFGCLFVFVANMYPTKWSLLRRLKSNPTWVKFIAGGILADGTSLWEDLQPVNQLLKELEDDIAMGHPEIFFSEVLNDETASANYLIDLSTLPTPPFAETDLPAGNFIIIDPATDKVGSDAVSVGYFEVKEAFPVLAELEEGSMSPGDTIKVALNYCLTHNCRLIVIEANAYQYSLKYWFDFICTQMGISGIEVVPIYSGGMAKNSRIISMLKSYAKGEIYVSENCKPAVHMQITHFNPLKRDNTDGLLDLLTYAPRVLSEFGEFVQISNIIDSQEFATIRVRDVSETSVF